MSGSHSDGHGHGHGHGGAVAAGAAPADVHQQHPLRVYFIVWVWLFILSFCSYMVDIMDFQGLLRWSLVLLFMVLKAGLIMAYFMHMVWERSALNAVILLPPVAVAVFMILMAIEGDYTMITRSVFFAEEEFVPEAVPH
jgi:cytochrome c oxidase subunit IV